MSILCLKNKDMPKMSKKIKVKYWSGVRDERRVLLEAGIQAGLTMFKVLTTVIHQQQAD